MRPKQFDIDPANVSLTGFLSNGTGATFTLTATSSGDGLAHQVSIRNDAATNHAGKTLALVGTDADGFAQTETVTGPGSSATVESSKYFLTLTGVTPSATIGADTFDIGFVDEVMSKTIPISKQVAAAIAVTVTGTVNYTVQETFEQVQSGRAPTTMLWHNITALAAKTASLVGLTTPGATAVRLVINSYTDTAEIQMDVSQG
jgi:hypothetical protein